MTRGEVINRRAFTGSQLVTARARLVELEKPARQTPLRDLDEARQQIKALEAEYADWRRQEAAFAEQEERKRHVEKEEVAVARSVAGAGSDCGGEVCEAAQAVGRRRANAPRDDRRQPDGGAGPLPSTGGQTEAQDGEAGSGQEGSKEDVEAEGRAEGKGEEGVADAEGRDGVTGSRRGGGSHGPPPDAHTGRKKMPHETPWTAASALRRASESIGALADIVERVTDKAAIRAATNTASLNLSVALLSLRRLLMRDRRFDLGDWRAYMLEFLPHLMADEWSDINAANYRLIAKQVGAMATALESLNVALEANALIDTMRVEDAVVSRWGEP